MIIFKASTVDDVSQIQEWTDADVYHRGQHNPGWWITGNGLLSFRVDDETGPLFYVRLDDGEFCRLSVQFAPSNVVSKRRLIPAMLETLPKLIETAKGSKGLIFDSVSPALIKFMGKMRFTKFENDSYLLLFGE